MSLKESHYVSPLTGKEVLKATYYRHVKKMHNQEPLNYNGDVESQSQSQIRYDPITSYDELMKFRSQSQSQPSFVTAETYYRDLKNHLDSRNNLEKEIQESQSQSQNDDIDLFLIKNQFIELKTVFKELFLAASSRGIPKKIAEKCRRWL